MIFSKKRFPVILLVILLALGALAAIWRAAYHEDLPDLGNMRAEARKARFLGIITPLIRSANADIDADRALLESLKRAYEKHSELSIWSRYRLGNLAEKYKLDTEDKNTGDKNTGEIINALLPRIDIVPALLVTAQAAKESGWGTSRFAQEGNNLFGQRCRSKGCGIVPRQRQEGASYEVQAYATPYHSIKSYMMNLNTHYAYKAFRAKRQKLDNPDTAHARKALVRSLGNYSERRGDYIEEVIAMMRQIRRESDRLP